MDKFVLDTSIFFNIESLGFFGKNTKEIIEKLNQKIIQLKDKKKAEFYVPPRMVEEFKSFFEKEEDFVKKFLANLTIKSADYGKMTINAEVFLKLVIDIRQRSYRGLAIGEEELKNMARLVDGKKFTTKIELEQTTGPIIKKFRDRYRQATRFGFLDSATDLDLIILTKEIGGFLVSVDEGLIHWGRIFGIKELPASLLGQRLDQLLMETD